MRKIPCGTAWLSMNVILITIFVTTYVCGALSQKVDVCNSNPDRTSLCTCSGSKGQVDVSCEAKKLTKIPRGIPKHTRTLRLNQNRLENITVEDLKGLDKLERLYLQTNDINYIEAGAFKDLRKLQIMNLKANAITTIDDMFQHLPKLQNLDLSDNDIQHFTKNAFMSMPKLMEVHLTGNPLQCGCEEKILRDWMNKQRKGFVLFANCANLNGEDIFAVPDAQFGQCQAGSMFPNPQRCHVCTNYDRIDSCPIQECEGGEVKCAESVTFEHGYLKVKKFCLNSSDCNSLEANNDNTCAIETSNYTCNYCCIDRLCNSKDLGGNIKSFDFYLEFVMQRKWMAEIKDVASLTFKKLAKDIESKIINILSGQNGSYGAHVTLFRPPNITASVNITSLTPSSYDKVDVWYFVSNALINAVESLRLPDILPSDVKVTSNGLCLESMTSGGKGDFYWKTTLEGETASFVCPKQPPAITHNAIATRLCAMSEDGTTGWNIPDDVKCKFKSEITQQLNDLIDVTITNNNTDSVSSQLNDITTNFIDFTQGDVSLTLTIMERMLQQTAANLSHVAISNIVGTVSNVLGVPMKELVSAEQDNLSATRLLQSVDNVLTKANLADGPLYQVHPNIALSSLPVDTGNFTGMSFTMDSSAISADKIPPSSIHILASPQDAGQDAAAAIVLPPSLFSQLSAADIQTANRVTFSVYQTDKIFSAISQARSNHTGNPSESGETSGSDSSETQPVVFENILVDESKSSAFVTKINSHVIAAGVPNVVIKGLTTPVMMTFQHISNSTNPRCVYWQEGMFGDQGGWSAEGCQIYRNQTDSNSTTCACNHLTNFALLMDIYSNQQGSSLHTYILSVISDVGCALSLIGLLLTILTYVLFRKLRRDNPSKILINLCIALAASNLVFLVGMREYSTYDPIACKAVAVLLHYFLLSAMAWMAIEAFYMYLALVLVFKTYYSKFILKCSLVGWGVPAIIVIITLISNNTGNYGLQDVTKICWLSPMAFYGSFLAPVALVLIMNMFAFGLVVRQLFGISAKNLNKTDTANTTSRLRGAVGVIVLLGLTWVFAIFAIDTAKIVFQYLFAIFNTLQGLFIFVFYCMFKKDVQLAWRKKLPCCQDPEDKSSQKTSSREEQIIQQTGFTTSAQNTAAKRLQNANSSSTVVNGTYGCSPTKGRRHKEYTQVVAPLYASMGLIQNVPGAEHGDFLIIDGYSSGESTHL